MLDIRALNSQQDSEIINTLRFFAFSMRSVRTWRAQTHALSKRLKRQPAKMCIVQSVKLMHIKETSDDLLKQKMPANERHRVKIFKLRMKKPENVFCCRKR